MSLFLLRSRQFLRPFFSGASGVVILGDLNDSLNSFSLTTTDTSPEIGVAPGEGVTINSVTLEDPDALIGGDVSMTQGANQNGATIWTTATTLVIGGYVLSVEWQDADGTHTTAAPLNVVAESGPSFYDSFYDSFYG